jgi:hypothetical protein
MRSRSVALVAVASMLASLAFAQESAEPPPVQAIWKEQRVTFYFQSFTTFYSCSSLETKIRRILIAVGASPDMRLRTRGCVSHNDVARAPYVQIELIAPVEATPEALAEREKTRTMRELVARVRGETKAAAEAAAQFPAQRRTVSLSRGKVYLEPGDCELVDQIKKELLPLLGVKIVEDDVRCSPHQLSMTQPKLVVEALFPMPSPDAAPDTKSP